MGWSLATSRALPNAGWRTLALAPMVAAALRARHKATRTGPRAVYVFTSSRAGPMDPRNANRLFTAFLTKYNLPTVRMHDLRHSAASLMLTSGATLDDVKRYLGHEQIGVTSDLYGHLVEGRSAEVAAGIQRALAR